MPAEEVADWNVNPLARSIRRLSMKCEVCYRSNLGIITQRLLLAIFLGLPPDIATILSLHKGEQQNIKQIYSRAMAIFLGHAQGNQQAGSPHKSGSLLP